MSVERTIVDVRAFDLIPENFDGRVSALCLHGLTGTPYEMRPIADELLRQGIRCVGPVMAGHGGTPLELAKTPYRAWVDLARKSVTQLRTQSDYVFVAGLSMGGLVTLALAAENCADAVAVLGTPLRFGLGIGLLIPLAKHVVPYFTMSHRTDIQNQEARERHPVFGSMPLASIHEVMKLQKVVRAGLPKITTPIFVGHGALDHTAQPGDARSIFGQVNAGERALYIADRSGHVVTVDHDGADLAKAIAEFLSHQNWQSRRETR